MIIPDLFLQLYWILRGLRPGGPVRFDDALGDPQALNIRKAAVRGDWQEVERVLEGCRDWDERAFYLREVGESGVEAPQADSWVEASSKTSTPRLMRGLLRIHWAWKARGGGKGDTVTEEGGQLFLDRLELADEDLALASEREPEDPNPWWLAVTTATGLGLDMDKRMDRFTEAIARHPSHREAHNALLNAILEKWGGSHDLMFGFARDRAPAMADGALGFLIPLAHIHRWDYAFRFDDDEEGARRYFNGKDVQAEIQAAHRLTFASVRGRDPRHVHADRNIFAFCFWKMGARAAGRKEFGLIGDVATTFPWSFGNSPTDYFSAARKACG